MLDFLMSEVETEKSLLEGTHMGRRTSADVEVHKCELLLLARIPSGVGVKSNTVVCEPWEIQGSTWPRTLSPTKLTRMQLAPR